jgi:hypothetical protein
MENPDNEDIVIPVCILLIVAGIQQYIATFFPFPAMFYLPCADHVILFVHDVVTP